MSEGRSRQIIDLAACRKLTNLVAAVGIIIFGCYSNRSIAGDSSTAELPQVKLINEHTRGQWGDFGIKPSPLEDDAKWCRRLFLDLVGRIPKYEELNAFLKNKDAKRRQKLVDELLDGEAYREEFTTHWATIWSNILIGRTGGTNRTSLISRAGMAKYLRDSLVSNKPYNRMVYELITATGGTDPDRAQFNGAVNFLIDRVNEEGGAQATAATSRIFLGLQIQCTQCHNHPFNQWKQQKFWDFNAFFRQARALRRYIPQTRDVDFAELVDQDFAGESSHPEEAEIFYLERNGLSRVAFPVFVDGTAIGRSGYVSEVNRRVELAKFVMASDYLDKMIVNRMWAQFLGYAFTKPLDDLGPHNSASHPELLTKLGEAMRNSSYDLRALMRWIVLSEPYQLSSRIVSGNEQDEPSLGEPPKFSRFYARQMSAEQLYQSLLTVGGQARGSLEQQQVERDRWLGQFVQAFGTDEGDEATTFNGTIPQALMMFNGELVKRATQLDDGSWLKQIEAMPTKPADKINGLFLTGLARRAKPEEITMGAKLLQVRNGKMGEMLQDLWWAILNSNEFILVH